MVATATTTTNRISSKWASLVAGIWIQSTNGAPAAFGVYSSALKSSQGYSQSTLDVIASVKNLGASFGALSGVLYSAKGCCGGPRVVLMAGAAQSLVGYLVVWAAVAGVFERPPVAVVCFFMWLAAHASTFSNTAVVVTAVNNFRENSGTAIGIMKGFLGLSPAILVQVYQTFYDSNPSAFLLMVSLVSTICPLCLMWFIRNDNTGEAHNGRRLSSFSLILVIIAAYLVVVTILQSFITLQMHARILVFLILLLLLASPPLNMLRVLNEKRGETPEIPVSGSDVNEQDSEKSYHELPCQADEEEVDEVLDDEVNVSIMQAIRTKYFWLLFLSLACSFGSGLAVINNLAQVSESLGYSSLETNTFISLWGIWNALGRYVGGSLSDYMQRVRGCPRPFFMTITICTLSIGHCITAASSFPGMLHVGSIVTGLCSGSLMSLAPSISSDLFGLADLGTIFNSIMLAGSVGSYVFSIIFGYIYDREASRQSGNACVGSRCFIWSFIIMAAANLFGSVVSMTLHLSTKRFYERIMVRRLRQCAKA